MRGRLKSMCCMFFLIAFIFSRHNSFQRKGFPSCLCQDKICLRESFYKVFIYERYFQTKFDKVKLFLLNLNNPYEWNSHFS